MGLSMAFFPTATLCVVDSGPRACKIGEIHQLCRLGAIQVALDRGWGKPTQAMDLGGELNITNIERVIVDSAN